MNTLLISFMEKKRSQYVEPLREGTPKGEPIGLSKVKYRASLYCLYDLRVKGGLRAVSKALQVDYGVLKKWRTEEGFRKQVADNIDEFSTIFVDFAEKAYRDYARRCEALRHLPATTLEKKPMPRLPEKDLAALTDAKFYSRKLAEAIALKAAPVPSDPEPLRLLVFSELLGCVGKRNPKVEEFIKSKKRQMAASIERQMINLLSGIIAKAKLSEDDKREAALALNILRNRTGGT